MSTPFEFEYIIRNPESPLGLFVESIWYARGTIPHRREKIAPTGSSVGVFVLGDPILQTPDNGRGETILADRGFLVGPHDRPVVSEPTGETYAIGIVTTPVGCEAVFGVPPISLRGSVVHLERVWPLATEIRSGLDGCSSPDAMLTYLEQCLAMTVDTSLPRLQRCRAAVSMLEEAPTLSISEVASRLGITHAYLDREFTRLVGLTPRSIARLLRMRGLLERIDVRSSVRWIELATEFGWFDQAHLIRDFKRHTGVTPSGYVEAQRALYSPTEIGEAAGFVPEM